MAKKTTVLNSNYRSITPNQFIDTMLMLYTSPIGINQPAKMLWGQPGIGKSQAVQQFADELAIRTGKTVNVKIVSLLLMSPIDLRGIPAKSVNDKGVDVAKWLPPDIFQMDASEKVINILFLDEISSAPLSVQAAAYQICLDKRVGEHKLPSNTIVICAGNRVTDKAVAFKMPKPLANRLTHFEMVADWNSWKEWAIAHEVDTRIISYLKHTNGESLNSFDTTNDDVAFATPRSWEMVNTYLKSISATTNSDWEKQFDIIFPCVEGCVGSGIAREFKLYLKTYSKLPNIEDIKNGKLTTIDKDIVSQPDIMYSLATVLVSVLSKEGKSVKWDDKLEAKTFNDMLSNISKYISSFPSNASEYKTYIVKDITMMWQKYAKATANNAMNNAEYCELITSTYDDVFAE